jgi:hypothetical protein
VTVPTKVVQIPSKDPILPYQYAPAREEGGEVARANPNATAAGRGAGEQIAHIAHIAAVQAASPNATAAGAVAGRAAGAATQPQLPAWLERHMVSEGLALPRREDGGPVAAPAPTPEEQWLEIFRKQNANRRGYTTAGANMASTPTRGKAPAQPEARAYGGPVDGMWREVAKRKY